MKFRFVVYIAAAIALVGFFVVRRHYQSKIPASNVTATYHVTPGDLFYFRPSDNQFVLLPLGNARHVCSSASGNLAAMGYPEKITLSHRTGQMMMENNVFIETDSPINRVAFSKDETLLIGGSEDGKVICWKVDDRKEVFRLQFPASVLDISVSPSGDRVVFGVSSNNSATPDTVQIWSMSGSFLSSWGTASATSVAFSPVGESVAAGFSDGSLMIDRLRWEATSPVSSIAWHPNGKVLASGHADKHVRLWNVETQTLIQEFLPPAPIESYLPQKQADQINVRLISPVSTTGSLLPKGIELVLFDSNGSRLAASFSDGDVFVWRL